MVISQVYGGGGNSGATLTHDFIELFNRGTTTVSLEGWSVQYTAASGTGTWQVTPLTGSMPPGTYFLVQEAQGRAVRRRCLRQMRPARSPWPPAPARWRCR